jgi:hypothetical protein
VLAALAQITHPAILGPITLGVVGFRYWWDDDRKRLLQAYVLATIPAIPFALLVLASPVFVDSSFGTKVWELADTLGPRCLIVAIPVAAVLLTRWRAPEGVAALACVAMVGATALTWGNQDMTWITKQLSRYPDSVMTDFTRSKDFEPGRVYRVLRTARDGKVAMYQVLKGGGRLDGEFFPESLMRESFTDEVEYSAKLRDRKVDVVVLFDSYGHNEGAMLERLASTDHPCDGELVCVRLKVETPLYRVYDVVRS